MFSDRDDIGSGDFDDRDTAVGLVGSIEINVVGSDTGGNRDLKFLRFGESFCGQVARVKAANEDNTSAYPH